MDCTTLTITYRVLKNARVLLLGPVGCVRFAEADSKAEESPEPNTANGLCLVVLEACHELAARSHDRKTVTMPGASIALGRQTLV
jgi:hypothetical protein